MNERFRNAEIRLFVFLIPFINLFNYYLTYNDIRFSFRTLITFAIDTAQGYIAWLVVHGIIIHLDKALPFDTNLPKRLAVQITLTLFAGLSTIALLTVIIHYSLKGGPFPVSFFSYDILIISVWFLVLNGVYISLDLYREWQASRHQRIEENKIKAGGLRVKSGKQDMVLAFDEIAGFTVDAEYLLCYTIKGKTFLLDLSMDKLEKDLPSLLFFRLNRQCLLHRQVIAGFEKAENGKLRIMLNSTPFSRSVNVSRTRAPEFKRWFYPE
jgi:hypothetical protein